VRAARRQRIDLSLLQQDGLPEFLQRALEVGQLDFNRFKGDGPRYSLRAAHR